MWNMWSFVHFLLLSQFHVVRHKYLIWLRYFMLFCIFANALWGKKLNTMAMERDMRWRLNFSHPTFPFPFPPFHYVGKVFLTAGLSLVNPSHYFDLFWCKCCSWIFDCLVQRQVYGSSSLSYCFFFFFLFVFRLMVVFQILWSLRIVKLSNPGLQLQSTYPR